MTMTTAAIQRELDRLADGPGTALCRCRFERMLCARRLQEALDAAERWYARREATRHRFSRRATTTVRRLVADARVRPSLAWAH